MNFFHKRELSAILAEYNEFSNEFITPKVPSYAQYILQILLGTSIAEDSQVADNEFIETENANILSIGNSFSTDWIVFAMSGQGDYWLINNTKNSISFYDHNLENFAINNAQELDIILEYWVILGDLFSQYDSLSELNPYAFNDDYTLKDEYKKILLMRSILLNEIYLKKCLLMLYR